MNKPKRILSILLALAMIIGIFPTVVPTVAEAAVTDTPAGVRNHLPATATDIVYLSDMTYKYSDNYADNNFKDRGYYFVKDGAWRTGKIVLGNTAANGGTTFEKGLGVMPKNVALSAVAADRSNVSYTVFDLADNDYEQSFFYSAVGITNQTGLTYDTGVVFEVWASYDQSVEDYSQASYVLLESSGTVKKTNVYQFHLDVTGARYLKLVVYLATDPAKLACMNCAWGGTCVYNNAGYYPKTDMIGSCNGDEGAYVAPENPTMFNTYNFGNLPENAVALATQTPSETVIYNPKLETGANWVGGVAEHIDGDAGTDAKPGQKDGVKIPNSIWFNVRKPAESNNETDGYVVYDVSGLNVNTFYAIVGSTNQTFKYETYNAANGNYGGLVFEVWGRYAGSDTYVLLSSSEPILQSNTGEFFVDITGVQLLKLRIRSRDTRSFASATGAFAYASVYCDGSYVTADGADSVVQGTQTLYTATVVSNREVLSGNAVNWAVEGAQKNGTTIDANGKLTVDPYETATELKITASTIVSGETVTSRPVTVAVKASPAYTLTLQGPAEVSKGSQHDISAIVTRDGETIEYTDIEWVLSGNSDTTGTKLENGKLTVGEEPVGTELTVKAGYTEYGILHEKTLTITVVAYEIRLDGYTEMLSGNKTEINASILNEGTPIEGTVTWTVDGIGTIEADGNKVTVIANNTAGTIKVTAKWTSPAGSEITKTHEIVANAYTVAVSGVATAVTKDSTLNLSADVEKNGVADTETSISWNIVNMHTGEIRTREGNDLALAVTEDVGTVLTITASVNVGGVSVSDSWTVAVTDYQVVIEPSTAEVMQGSSVKLEAGVSNGDTTIESPVISWQVSKADGSALCVNGNILTLSADETVGTVLTVVATAVVDGRTIVSAPATITVTAAPGYAVTITDPAASAVQGESVSFDASVTRDGEADTQTGVIWLLSGQTKTGTVIDSNGTLTVDKAEPVGTSLRVTAAVLVDGKLVCQKIVYVKVEPAVRQDAYQTFTGTYKAVPGNAIWLSGELEKESSCLGNASARYDEQWTSGTFKEIWLGGASGGTVNQDGGVRFYKGVAMQPFGPSEEHPYGECYAIYDLSDLDVDTFYAAVGLTNQAGQNSDENTANGQYGGIYYEVWASYAENDAFSLLAKSELITKTTTGEFTVDVADVKLLKLVVKCKNNTSSAHASMSGMWANACVFSTREDSYAVTVTGSAAVVKQGGELTFTASATKNDEAMTNAAITWTVTGGTAEGTKIDANGKLTVDVSEKAGTELKITASIMVDGETVASATVSVQVKEAEQTAGQKDAYTSSDGSYISLPQGVIYLSDLQLSECLNLNNITTILDGTYSKGANIYIGGTSGDGKMTDGTYFEKGLGVMPLNPTNGTNGTCYTIYDISALNVDTFYAAVGITNQLGQDSDFNESNSWYGGVIFSVYADYGDGTYKLLAESEVITKTMTGEFRVDVTGVKNLKLTVRCKYDANSAHASMNSVWAGACVYSSTSQDKDEYSVTIKAEQTTARQGDSIDLIANVRKNGEVVSDTVLSWSVTGGTAEDTRIDANGKLTIGASEKAGTELKVTASITVDGETITSNTVIVQVTEAEQTAGQKDAYTSSNGNYVTLPNGVIWLSDIDWIESANLSGIEAIRNGAYKTGDIWLGGESGGKVTDGTKFTKGLGVMPFAPNDGKNGAAHTIWDVSALNADTFYAVVGITNENGQNYGYGETMSGGSNFAGGGVIFLVYGDYEGNGDFRLLAQSEVISKTMTGEFKVDISGVKTLKLVVKCNLDTSTGHHSMNSAWGNACVYSAGSTSRDSYSISVSGAASELRQGENMKFTASVLKNGEAMTKPAINWAVTGGTKTGTRISADGKLTIDKKEPAGTRLRVTASITVDGTTYTSAAFELTVTEAISQSYQKDAFKSNTTGIYAQLAENVIYLSDVAWIESVNLNNGIAIRNGAWSNGSAIWIGGESNDNIKDGTEFKKGIGVQPQAPNSENNNGASWTTIDVGALECDTFYAAVGITNKSNQENGHNSFIFQVFGAAEKDGEFILLAESTPLTKTETGEFTVDISGIQVLKLVIKCTENGTHAYGNSVWANACVYNKDGSAGNPDGGAEDKPAEEKPEQDSAYTSMNKGYAVVPNGVQYLSDLDWLESMNLSDIEAIRNGTYKNGDTIWLGGESGGKVTDGTKFTKGLGVQPYAPNDGKYGAAHTIWDVSALNVDTFYAVVGITNQNGQNYGYGDILSDGTPFAGVGLIFQVYGDYEGNGEYRLLAQSEMISKTTTGEFKVDISGVKTLKLVVKCDQDTGTGHYSMNCAWGNACVFDSSLVQLGYGETPGNDATEPSVPTATRPKPVAPTDPSEPSDPNSNGAGVPGLVIALIVVLLAAAVAAVVIIAKKRRKTATPEQEQEP